MTSQNPYEGPRVDESYVDPLLHHSFSLDFDLSQEDVKAGIKQYVINYPLLMLFGISCVFVIGVSLAIIEAFGNEIPAPALLGVLCVPFIFGLWYVASLWVRAKARRSIAIHPELAPGRKTVGSVPLVVKS